MNTIQSPTHSSSDEGGVHFNTQSLAYCKLQGKQHGEQGIPRTLPEFHAYIFNTIETDAQRNLDRNQQYLPRSGAFVARSIQSEADQKVRTLQGNIYADEQELIDLDQRRKQLMPDKFQSLKRGISYVVAVLIGIGEGVLVHGALRRSGFSAMPALALSVALASGISLIVHIGAEYIRRAVNRQQVIKRTILVIFPAMILFTVLGYLRSSAINTDAELDDQLAGVATVAPVTAGWKIAIISIALYSIGLLITVRYARTKQEKEQEKAHSLVNTEYKKLLSKRDELEVEIKKIKQEAELGVKVALQNFERAVATENEIQSEAKVLLQAYIAANLRHRPGGDCPAFFSNPPAFTFTTYFKKPAHYEMDNTASAC